MKVGIFTKYLLSSTILIVLSLTISFFVSNKSIKKSYLKQNKEHLFRLAKAVKILIEDNSFDFDSYQFQQKIKNLSESIDSRISIIMQNGTVKIDSEKNPISMENHKNRPEIIDAARSGKGYKLRWSNTLKKEMLYLAIPIYQSNEIIAFVRVSNFSDEVFILLDSVKKIMLSTFIFLTFFSFMISYILANHFTKPIKQLAKASQEVAKGNYQTHIFTNNRDETYELTSGFNYMTEKINEQITEISKQSEELSTIIGSIREIFFVIDNDEKIIYQNQEFINFIQNKNFMRKKYWEIIDDARLIEEIDNVLKVKKNNRAEIKIGENYYLFSSSFLQKSSSAIFLLYDITEINNLQEVKKDFVVNASHELRTPLTSIKGFLETMAEDSDEDNSYYLKILNRNTDRLISIVNDILTLSKIEANPKLSFEEIDIRKVLQNTINIFAQKDKEIKFILNFEEIPKIKSDPFKLEQVFVNLIDNAIKYSNDDSITISLVPENNFVRIDFSDNGIGIKKEQIPRLFERFYVVDKSRTRKVGGTGLGLSIVKHIIQQHNGKINIQSEYGKGTTVQLWLPISI
ncbi:MAG: ATP-binding protein [Candidatus Cloacimonadota bacterium]|nr:ATP-binding protein [Candidatus Cloacimonadota bacterium]